MEKHSGRQESMACFLLFCHEEHCTVYKLQLKNEKRIYVVCLTPNLTTDVKSKKNSLIHTGTIKDVFCTIPRPQNQIYSSMSQNKSVKANALK